VVKVSLNENVLIMSDRQPFIFAMRICNKRWIKSV